MGKTKTSFGTGEIVEQSGNYICESGRRTELSEGDKFPYCPVTGLDTSWDYVQ